jgi:hypothetical protein
MVGRMLQFQLASHFVNVGFLLVADLYKCLSKCCALPWALVLELVEMFLKAATTMSSYSQQPSLTSFVYVRSRIITGEHGIISAAPGISAWRIRKRFTTRSVLLWGVKAFLFHWINIQLGSTSRSHICVGFARSLCCCCSEQYVLRIQRMYLRNP